MIALAMVLGAAEHGARDVHVWQAAEDHYRLHYGVPLAARYLAWPPPERFRDVSPESPALTAEVRAEVLRLTSTDLRKASYPVTPGRRDKGSVALAARRVGQYLELAADGPTRTYSSNGTTVTEYDATEDTDGYITDLGELQAEITRYLNMRADLMRQSPLVGDAGNRSYSPPTGPPSASAPGLVPIGGAESAPDGTTSDPR